MNMSLQCEMCVHVWVGYIADQTRCKGGLGVHEME